MIYKITDKFALAGDACFAELCALSAVAGIARHTYLYIEAHSENRIGTDRLGSRNCGFRRYAGLK
jgi:hypothetical protein